MEQLSIDKRKDIFKPTKEITPELESGAQETKPSSEPWLSFEERAEARKFSRENSQAARSRLAQQIIDERWKYRVTIPNIKAEQDAALAIEQEEIAGQQAQSLKKIEALEQHLTQLKIQREQWVALETQLRQVEQQIEKAKKPFWAYITNTLAKLEAKKIEIYQQGDSVLRIDEWQVPRAEKILAQKKLSHAESVQYAKDRIQYTLNANKMKLQRLITDDNWVETSRKQINEFYKRNLGLKREREENPEQHDVAWNCRRHNIVLTHGFPIKRNPLNTHMNQPHFDTENFLGQERALFMAALEPAIATASKSLNPQTMEFPRKELYYQTGFILGGGEIMSAYPKDAGTYAHGLDSRFPKYDNNIVSDYQENITQALDIAVNSTKNMNNSDAQYHYNEISVRHPKISALYIHDADGDFGNPNTHTGYSSEYIANQKQHDRSVFKEMLSLAVRMGLPLILIKKSREMINVTDGKRLVTLDELLDNPMQYSLEERLAFLEEANVALRINRFHQTKIQAQIQEKIERLTQNFTGIDPVMEERKQRNSDLAKVQLKLLDLYPNKELLS